MPIYMNGKVAQQAQQAEPVPQAPQVQPSQNVDLSNVNINELLASLISGKMDGESNKDFDDKADLETMRALAKAAGTVTSTPKLDSNLGDKVVINAGDKNQTLDLLKDI